MSLESLTNRLAQANQTTFHCKIARCEQVRRAAKPPRGLLRDKTIRADPRRIGPILTACQCLMVRLAQMDDEGKLGDHHAALAKAFCTAKSRETVAWGRELLGGNGIVADFDVARFFADAEALYSYEGTYQMQNLIVGKAITGLGAFV